MTWQSLAEDIADEFGAYEPPPVYLQLVDYVAVRTSRRNERRRKLLAPREEAATKAPRAVKGAEHWKAYKAAWQRQERARQREVSPPRKPGRPRKDDAHKLAVEQTYALAYRADKKHARMLAGELGVHMSELEARARTARLLGRVL